MVKALMLVKINELIYGKKLGVTLKEAKKAFLSGMSKNFKKNVKVKFIK